MALLIEHSNGLVETCIYSGDMLGTSWGYCDTSAELIYYFVTFTTISGCYFFFIIIIIQYNKYVWGYHG